MESRSSIARSLVLAFQIPLTFKQNLLRPTYAFRTVPSNHASQFSTSSGFLAYSRKRPKGSDDPRCRMIRYCLKHPKTPRPLRFSRDRALRHWTIHRAAQLLLHKTRRERERALEKQYNAMRDAMEELRLGCGDGGRLYRQAVTKQGVYGGSKMEQEMAIVGNGGIPLEYARAQTEGPPVGGFNEDWKRT